MDPKERRRQLLELLQMDIKPVSASNLAEHFGVSRQIIVGDIALLRAAGTAITSTARGYVLDKSAAGEGEEADGYVLVCRHDKSMLEQELYTILDNGGQIVNVSVDHPIYGAITQPLNIRSRYDADQFLKQVAVSGASLLASLTDGVHLHTVKCPDNEAYKRILVMLKEQGILYTALT